MRRIRLCMLLLFCTAMISSCISEGDETYVLEEPALKASQMIIGSWKKTATKIMDEEGNEIKNPAIDEEMENIPDIAFDENGNYTVTYPDGNTDTGSWNISDDESHIYIGDISWEIYSFGENRLVIIYQYYYEEEYYYIMYIFDRTSYPEEKPGDGEIPEIGDISDNNPYKPWEGRLVSKITLTRRYTRDNTTSKTVYLFQYDKKSRIIEYTEQNYNTVNNTVANSDKFNFIYDDSKVYLYHNGELMNTGIIGKNGYLSTLYEGNSTEVNSTFTYDSDGYVTYLKTDNQEWTPSYGRSSWVGQKNMTSPQKDGDQLSYETDAMNNVSVDFNGLMTTCYQWEWFMHYDFSGVVLGLFDFYGKRSSQVASKVVRGTYWTDQMTDWRTINDPDSNYIPTLYQITRTGLNNPFVATYEIEYYQ